MVSKSEAKKDTVLAKIGKRIDEASVWHKRILAIVAIFATVSGAAVAISGMVTRSLDGFIREHTSGIATAVEENSQLIKNNSKAIQANTAELNNVRQDTLRVQLMQYIQGEPSAHDTILKLGYTYFVEYHGDWVMTNKFKEWAKSEGVDIPFDLSH